ncbi:MAG: methyl-accepting chemotaxis protein [Muribaculaceae bacterium]|nr:methyl-accepting chemotaxis protein [Roseburia sp.]MCM1431189.1 methyl-accepting chemotaxis protein [Muribaculaceae bacterium]MCM1492325.1 methyl-accepting chemotaxis protein [Muribaculaceae bacterium]
MNLNERHRQERNKITFIVALIIMLYSTVMALLGLLDKTANMGVVVPRVIVCVMIFVVYLVCHFLLRSKPQYVLMSFICMFLTYGVTVLTQRNVYMYALVYPIMIVAVLYLNRRFAAIVMTFCIVINIIAGVKNFNTYKDTATQSFMQMFYVAIFCVIVFIVEGILERQAKENTDEILRQMDTAELLSKEIIGNSEKLVHNLDFAKEKAESLTQSMETTNASIAEIAESVKFTAEAIETQTMRTSDIQSNIENADKQTLAMRDNARESQNSVQEGVELILALREKAIQTSEITRKTKENTVELDNSIKEVESITATILGISQQTNLLSLNASIEAARAGEAGKGFAVVADEIRNLSDETKASTEQIKKIIEKLTESVTEASGNMEKSARFVEEQGQMIDDTKEKFDTVIEKTEVLFDTIETLSNEITEIVEANNQINDSITNLSATSEEVAASSENGTSISEESMRAMIELNQILDEIFTISETLKKLVER